MELGCLLIVHFANVALVSSVALHRVETPLYFSYTYSIYAGVV